MTRAARRTVLLCLAVVTAGTAYAARRCIVARLTEAGWKFPLVVALNSGMAPNSSCHGWSWMQAAVGSRNVDLVNLLVSRGADVNNSPRGATPLAGAAAMGQEQMVKALLAAGADINMRSSPERSLLLAPVHNGHLNTVRLLIARGADVRGDSAALLSEAVRENHLEIMRVLLDAGAQPNARERRGATPLMWAAAYADFAHVRLLLAQGADPNLKDDAGRTAADWARREGRTAMAKLLMRVQSSEAGSG